MKPTLAFAAAVALGAIAVPSAAAVTQKNFELRSGADLVALCTVSIDDPLHAEAIHFCHGFAVGTYRTIRAMTHHKDLEPLFCPPNPGPTRNEGVAAFVRWARENPEHQDEAPEEYVGRYLIATYPCPQPDEGDAGSAGK